MSNCARGLAQLNEVAAWYPTVQQTLAWRLCTPRPERRSRLIAEYALKDMHAPMGVSSYQITEALPESLQSDLPGIEELEASLNRATATDEATDEQDMPAAKRQ